MSDPPTRHDSVTVAIDPSAAPGRLAIRVCGEIDVETAPLLQRRLTGALNGETVDLVLDVSGVSFCDVAGLDVILRVRSELSSRGGRLALAGYCRPLQIMIGALGLEDALPLTALDAPG